MSSVWKTLCKWYCTVRGLMKQLSADLWVGKAIPSQSGYLRFLRCRQRGVLDDTSAHRFAERRALCVAPLAGCSAWTWSATPRFRDHQGVLLAAAFSQPEAATPRATRAEVLQAGWLSCDWRPRLACRRIRGRPDRGIFSVTDIRRIGKEIS
jgi:hypothetical protein